MKGFSVKSGFGIGAIIFAVAAIIALPVRTIQFFTVLEGGTGFFNTYDWSVYLLYALLTGVTLAFIILGLSKRKKLDFSREVEKHPVAGIISLLTAVTVFIDGISCANTVMNSRLPLIDYNNYGTTAVNTEKLIFGAEALFAVISAIFFLSLGIVYLTGKTNGSEHKIISLAPVIWCIIRMVYRFTRTISYQRVSDLTFEFIMLAFMIMFFMAFAQVNSQISSKNCEWKLAGYGLPAALFALVCFAPRLIITVIGNEYMLYEYSSAEFCDFGVAIFICSVVFTKIIDRVEAKSEIPAESTTEG